MASIYADIPIAGGDTATPLNLAKRATLIGKYLQPGKSKVIDCGCGEGGYIQELARRYQVDCVGIEYLPEKVAEAHRNPAVASLVTQADIEHIPFADASFDIAILNEVLEHVPSEAKALAEIHRVLMPGGKVMIMSPNRWFPFESHGVYWKHSGKRVPSSAPLIPYIPIALGSHVFRYWARNYWQGELAAIVRAAKFKIIDRTWIWQTFENITGRQPLPIRVTKPILRNLAATFEKTPVVRRFGISQVIVAERV